MKIRSSAGDYIELTKIKNDERGDFNAKVRASVCGFQASNKSVWFDLREIARFKEELNGLDKTRIGVASIDSLSPNECKLIIQNVDKIGHIGVRLWVSKVVYQYGKSELLKSELLFEINSDYMNTLYNEFIDEFK